MERRLTPDDVPRSIALVTGVFPQLSETFIVRKACALLEAGADVTVLARQVGDLRLFERSRCLDALRFKCLPPDNSLNGRRALVALASIRKIFRAPPTRLQKWMASSADSAAKVKALHLYRHLPFLDLQVDVLHFEFVGLAAMYPDVGRLLGIPVVVSSRGSDINLLAIQPELVREQHVQALRAAAAVHCVSAALAEEVVKLRGRSQGVFVNRPAVDADAIVPSAREANAKVKIIAVGRLVWIKGFDYLLAALSELDRAGYDFEAEIIGDGPLMTSLQFSLMELGIEHRVHLLGALAPVETLTRLRAADIFVLSSHSEGISNSALEAMAAGLPVVTTNAGGMAEAVRDGVDGFVVEKRDVGLLVDRLQRLLMDANLRATMGRNARQRVIDEFSLSRQAQRFLEVYHQLTEGPIP